jgi:hypothetical protein
VSCLEDPEPARPTHGEVVAAFEPRPFTACVLIVHNLAPTSHVGFVINQVLAPGFLTKVEDILPEETFAGDGSVTFVAFATCFHNSPSVGSIRPFVSEQNPSMTTTLKHLKSHNTPSSAEILGGLAITPTVQAVVVNCESVVNPELASIIGVNRHPVAAGPEDSEAACPAHGEVITSGKTSPFATCVAIIHHLAPASHVRSAPLQVLAPAALTKVEGVLPELAIAVDNAMRWSLLWLLRGFFLWSLLLLHRKVIEIFHLHDAGSISVISHQHKLYN